MHTKVMTEELNKLIDKFANRQQAAHWIFFRRFLKNPVAVASLTPSSPALGRLVAQHIRRAENEYVVELGCGTGAITRPLLESGVPPEKLIAVDLDAALLDILRDEFPDLCVLECDASEITRHLPPAVVGKVGTVVCGIPVSLLPRGKQQRLVEEMFALMPPGNRFLAYTHRPISPLPRRELGLKGTCLARTLRNLPPASVWGYTRAA